MNIKLVLLLLTSIYNIFSQCSNVIQTIEYFQYMLGCLLSGYNNMIKNNFITVCLIKYLFDIHVFAV